MRSNYLMCAVGQQHLSHHGRTVGTQVKRVLSRFVSQGTGVEDFI